MGYLPENVMYNVLSRLPVKTIIHCKCVCKDWQNLILDSYFVDLHLSRSREGLMIHHLSHQNALSDGKTGFLKFVETEDEADHHRMLRDLVMSIDLNGANLFPYTTKVLVGSVNGLICLWEYGGRKGDNTYICNPITREYMMLPKQNFHTNTYCEVRYGFGVSRKGEYKVIRMFERSKSPNPVEVEVYTLGTNHWRTLDQGPVYVKRHDHVMDGLLLNGYVHWMDSDILFAFDLDNEKFHLFGPTPRRQRESFSFLGVLKGCVSRFSWSYERFTVWMMKEHGIKKSWHKELEIKYNTITRVDTWLPSCLIDGLNNTSILIVYDGEKDKLVAYCLETDRVEETGIYDNIFKVMTYRPSFLKLQNFQSEGVHVF
ncbi:F-box associated domain, type 1 [Artemisia annua]|uniref:F-box associated domain, type 1 n=1 Tax=Artemisia annua TaxID=35608 RepID=A0A2U1P0V2_ARTAN|nr:F-box associated domain, type 1 [Artemisia annua]